MRYDIARKFIIIYGREGLAEHRTTPLSKIKAADCYFGNGRRRQMCSCATCDVWRSLNYRKSKEAKERRDARYAKRKENK